MFNKFVTSYILIISLSWLTCISLFADDKTTNERFEKIVKKIESDFGQADIPGLSLVLVDGDSTYFKSWGYADIKNRVPVTSKTLFELGSTSKAFTALAILKLQEEGLLRLDDKVSKFIPWFRSTYSGAEVQITLGNLLHHTSGIPMETISRIPQGDDKGMLERTVRENNNIELKKRPGEAFEYATINYDVLGLIIEKVSGFSFEEYMHEQVFQKLGLESTSVGDSISNNIAKGYKVSFFTPRAYQAPRFKGNNPAGYVISNGEDIAKWIRLQLGLDSSCYNALIMKSHVPDLTVVPSGLSSYAAGWFVTPYGDPSIYHGGLNPNFSSFVGLLPSKGVGFALLSNSNSEHTAYLGDVVLRLLNEKDTSEIPIPDNGVDKVFSMITIVLILFLGGILWLLIWVLLGIVKKERELRPFSLKILFSAISGALLTIPFIFGIYILPNALMGFTWDTITVWAPNSFYFGSMMFLIVLVGVWFLNFMSAIFPSKNKHYNSLPLIIILSIMSGLANMVLILLLINAIGSDAKTMYLLYYFILALVFYISSRKFVQTKLLRISTFIVYELRMRLINKIFLSSYQEFERIDKGRVITTLTQDTAMISNSANIFIGLISNMITIVGVFIYLGTISLIATTLILSVIAGVAILYYFVSRSTNILFEQARDAANVFSSLIDGLLYGFKELSLSGLKKSEYTQEVEASCSELQGKASHALVKFVNAILVGETLLIMVLGTISFVIPFLFPEIPNYRLLGFIMIVLYLIGPINGVLNSIPNVMQIRVSWNRIKGFIKDITPDLSLTDIISSSSKGEDVKNVHLRDVVFEYKNGHEDRFFRVGPINLSINQGEILFIVGGNGSGKSTLANLLTGLYSPDEGYIEVNGERLSVRDLGAYYSTVFSNHHIFKKLYGIDIERKEAELKYLLKLFHLEEKVSVENGAFSSIDLSNGQRKRMSLMKCFLEDSQIYLFDEWAADQDPEYKKVFYRKLLPEMKQKGKIVIAITHDDNYFDVADKVMKMDMGRMVEYKRVTSIKEISFNI